MTKIIYIIVFLWLVEIVKNNDTGHSNICLRYMVLMGANNVLNMLRYLIKCR